MPRKRGTLPPRRIDTWIRPSKRQTESNRWLMEAAFGKNYKPRKREALGNVSPNNSN